MEQLANKIAEKASLSLNLDSERQAVIAYGLTAIIQIIVTVALVLVFGLIIRAPLEALVVCFSISILRKYSGGAHVGSIGLCTTLGVIDCIVLASISKYLLLPFLTPYVMIPSIVVAYALSFFAIYKLAPVDSPNKPIKTEKKKKRMRKGSYIILSVYFAISVLLLIVSFRFRSVDSLGACLLFGTLWQIFTLTKFGSLFLKGIEFTVKKAMKGGVNT